MVSELERRVREADRAHVERATKARADLDAELRDARARCQQQCESERQACDEECKKAVEFFT